MRKALSKYKRALILFAVIGSGAVLIVFVYFHFFSYNPVLKDAKWGMAIDSFNNVKVYYNGSVSNTNGRNKTNDGYNLGLKYQCVEFVKRYYFEHLNHKMPDSYGNAKDFFDVDIIDGAHNAKRDLTQFTNPSKTKPKVDDLIIFNGSAYNSYGHVAIVCKVADEGLTIIQQNPGSMAPSRVSIGLTQKEDHWEINNSHILGWLRKE
jgi:surface antigen